MAQITKEQEQNDARLHFLLAHVAASLKRYLRLMRLTQRQAAKMLGVEVSYLNNVLSCKANLTLRTITKLEKSTGLILLNVPHQTREYNPPIDRTCLNYTYALAA